MKIAFIATGGTIDKAYSKKKGTYNFDIMDPAVSMVLRKVQPNFEFEVLSVLKKDSLDIDDGDRCLITEVCRNIRNDRIVITHGTDTMLDTARELSCIKDKTIILTGAAQPERFKDTDADFNLGVAVGAVNALPRGVYIAMNGRVYSWDKCEKLDSGHFVAKGIEK